MHACRQHLLRARAAAFVAWDTTRACGTRALLDQLLGQASERPPPLSCARIGAGARARVCLRDPNASGRGPRLRLWEFFSPVRRRAGYLVRKAPRLRRAVVSAQRLCTWAAATSAGSGGDVQRSTGIETARLVSCVPLPRHAAWRPRQRRGTRCAPSARCARLPRARLARSGLCRGILQRGARASSEVTQRPQALLLRGAGASCDLRRAAPRNAAGRCGTCASC